MRVNLLFLPGLTDSREITIETGRLSRGKVDLIHGVVGTAKIDSRFVAVSVYALQEELFFQVGRQRWSIRKFGLQFAHRRLPYSLGLLNEFVAKNYEGDVVFSRRYVDRYWLHGKNWLDFTYDDLDRELDDIFFWIARTCGDKEWQKQFAVDWTKGLPMPGQSQAIA